jgi:hypothetical protein
MLVLSGLCFFSMTHRHEEMTMKPEPEMSEADGTCEKIKCDGQKMPRNGRSGFAVLLLSRPGHGKG